MAQRIIWSEAAWNDLEATADYIAKDSRRYAAALVREVKGAARSLRSLPQRGRVVPEFGDFSIRELFVRNYRLIYQVKPDAVHIVGFIHGSRNLWSLWERERRAL
jgi:plasmid stabilization system protein ParE